MLLNETLSVIKNRTHLFRQLCDLYVVDGGTQLLDFSDITKFLHFWNIPVCGEVSLFVMPCQICFDNTLGIFGTVLYEFFVAAVFNLAL